MRINAPMCVVVNLVEKGSRRALHLINYTGDMRENRAYKVEWVAPLSGLSVGVRPPAGSRLVRANILGSRAALTSEQKDGLNWVALPRLSVYECVEFEYHEGV
jgi:hypothetical protein